MMSKLRPVWQELPVELKEQVVSLLDLKSRASLSKCSRADHQLTLNSPIFLTRLEIMLHTGSITIFIADKYKSYCIETQTLIAIETFVKFLGGSKKSTFDWLQINIGSDYIGGQFLFQKYNLLMSHLFSKCTFDGRLKVRSFRFSVYQPSRKTAKKWWLPEVFRLFDPHFFEYFVLDADLQIQKSIFSKIMKSEQWRRLKKYKESCRDHELEVEKYFHLEKLEMENGRQWKTEEVVGIVKNFQSQNFPLFSYFKLNGKLPAVKIGEQLGIRADLVETLPCSLPSGENYVLMIRLKYYGVFGVICRKDKGMEDLYHVVGGYSSARF